MRPRTLAVVGAGPKALFCVERLVSRGLAEGRPAPLRIVVLDPHPVGHGAAYAADQPARWRLNVTSRIVDTAWRTGDAPTPFPVPTLDEWRLAHGEASGAQGLDPFPSRALVGRYLTECWAEVAAHLPGGWTLEHRATLVREVAPQGTGWWVNTDGDTAESPLVCDDVLLATGHGTTWPGALAHDWDGPGTLVPHVYPADALVDVPAGAHVVVRGAALTFLDVALELAERGVASIVPTSRSGRFMVPKPDPVRVAAPDQGARAADAAADVRAARGDVDAILARVEALAGEYLGGGPVSIEEVVASRGATDPVELLRAEIAVAAGETAPDATWALGQAWRDVYAALVDTCTVDTLDAAAWSRFREVAGRLEPIGFGPPLVNARTLDALIAAGTVDASAMAQGLSTAEAAARIAAAHPDAPVVVVDAVLPPPGVTAGLLRTMVDAGLLHVRGRGVHVDADLRVLDDAGRPRRGLGVVGRPTEDVVLGNDTLNRSLHEGPDRWARRFLQESR